MYVFRFKKSDNICLNKIYKAALSFFKWRGNVKKFPERLGHYDMYDTTEWIFYEIVRDIHGDFFGKELKTGAIFPIFRYYSIIGEDELYCASTGNEIWYAINVYKMEQPTEEEIEEYRHNSEVDWKYCERKNTYRTLPIFHEEKKEQLIPKSEDIEEETPCYKKEDIFITELDKIHPALEKVKKIDEDKYKTFITRLGSILKSENHHDTKLSLSMPYHVYSINEQYIFMSLERLLLDINAYLQENILESCLIDLNAMCTKMQSEEFDFDTFSKFLTSFLQLYSLQMHGLSILDKRKIMTKLHSLCKQVSVRYNEFNTDSSLEYRYIQQMHDSLFFLEDIDPSNDKSPKQLLFSLE